MIRRTLRTVGSVLVSLGRSEEPPKRPASQPKAQGAEQPDAFGERAQEILKARRSGASTVLAGTVQLVGLNDVRKEFGADWGRVADKAHVVAEAAIRQHLSKTDLYQRQDAETFVLCFPTLSKSQAEQKARLIVDEIKTKLARDLPEAKAIGVQQFVAEVDYGGGLEAGQSLAEAMLQSLQKIRAEAETAFLHYRQALLKDAEVFYRPVWDTARKAVPMFRSVVDEHTSRTSLDYIQSLSSPDELHRAIADLDCLMFSRTIKDLHGLVQDNGKAWFLVPVHFETLNAKPSREEYVKLCEAVPEAYRSFVLLEMYGIPESAPTGRLLDFVALLRGSCRALVFDVSLNEKRLADLGAAGVFGISTDLSEFHKAPTAVAQRFARFAELAQMKKLATIAHGADSLGLVGGAITAGFSYVSGQGIMPVMPKPRNSFRLNPTL